ncbi:hypothetical protein NADFUDRAFT_82332 [Nadsonia fulvescens var. elongata DSM 6958]|uniref:Sulfite reductase [NADPH] subunit beta n=1 Tax=Nadsonia fulvescens var. elongata DSM 6958 TaxID=857566 RepID=A0A1E3PM84_9ASCO|nr:hypothetical protein NADFUDRAFT_82332 [Nadsonia fulvescens var. elongata DSM 6958]
MAHSLVSQHSAVAHVASAVSGKIFTLQSAFAVPTEAAKALKDLSSSVSTTVLRDNTDPFATIAEYVRSNSTLTTVTTTSAPLVQAIPRLSSLAGSPVVIHIDLTADTQDEYPDYAKITALRHVGFVFLQSFGVKDAQDMALAASIIAVRLAQPVIHFFTHQDSTTPVEALDPIAIQQFVQKTEEENTLPTAALVDSVFTQLEPLVKTSYKSIEYTGNSSATTALVVFGSSYPAFQAAITQAASQDNYADKVGLALIRVYRPWRSADVLSALPSSITHLALAEQIRRPTTTWSPLVLDFVADIHANEGDIAKLPELVAFQLGKVDFDNVKQALTGIVANIHAEQPVQNLLIGSEASSSASVGVSDATTSAQSLESAYTKVLAQLFGNELSIINATNSASALGDSTSPEHGFGAFLALERARSALVAQIELAIKANSFSAAHKTLIVDLLARWVLHQKAGTATKDNAAIKDLDIQIIAALQADTESTIATELLAHKDLFSCRSSWLVGSDAWSYDLGNSGVHHVISSGKNVNMLVIDSQPYSEASPAIEATRRKKDIGLYAMNFGNVYVASVAVYASYTQLLGALIEADKFDGPSVVLAYLPYHSEVDNALTVLQETKRAVDSGYWPLYRFNPNDDNEDTAFRLDSSRVKRDLQDFLDRENRLTLLSRQNPVFARSLDASYGTEVKRAHDKQAKAAYTKLLDGLAGAPLTILFASDGGVAEAVAKKLQFRAKARGLKAIVLAMDDYPVEDLSTEVNVVLISSTAGQGEFPQNGRNFWEAIKGGASDIDLAEVSFAVFGLGDSEYWPRKEDKIYYNKPGRELQARFELLGGKQLVELGLGDEQDADGYLTAYNVWEGQLWTALGVDGLGGSIEEPKPFTNEDIKIASNYLRGTIAEALIDESTGAVSAHDQQVTKFHGIYMQDDRDIRDQRKAEGLEPAFSFMARVRLPGCKATPAQWLKMDELADTRGNGTFKITTRATFQLHGVVKHNLKAAIRGMNSALIDTVAACGDVNRNVVTAALPGNAKIHKEIAHIGYLISEHLLPQTTAYHEIWLEGPDPSDDADTQSTFANRPDGPKKKKTMVAGSTLVDHEPLYGPTYLPRKFKINICVPPYNDVDVYAHDIGLISIVDPKANELLGFNVQVGGGMGTTHNNKKTYPRTGSSMGFVTKDKIVEVCEKVMLVQRDNGDRTNRKHARLKYTVDDMGNDGFRAAVEEHLGYKFEPERAFKIESNTDHFGWVTDETGLHHFTSFIENGRVEDTPELPFKTGLREIAKILDGEFRLTGNQHVLISNVKDSQLDEIKTLLAKYKLDNVSFSGLRLSSAACVAFPTCGLAMAESERYLPVLITKLEECLEEYGLRHDSIVMRMTGCPNGCARPWLAEIALVGKALGAYNLLLGGGHIGQRINKLYRQSLKEDEIIAVLKPLFKRWALERNQGEPFGDFVIRAGIIAETTEGKNFWDNLPEEA